MIWYPALKDAPDLGRVSLVARPEWDEPGQEWAEGGVADEGEWLSRQTVPGALGAHVCGSVEDFREGCTRDESNPPVLYGVSGLPQCCEPPVIGGAGGAMGGRATVVWDDPPGPTCATATTISIGQIVEFTTTADAWFRLPTVPGAVHVIETLSGRRVPQTSIEAGATWDCSVVFGATLVVLGADLMEVTVSSNPSVTALMIRNQEGNPADFPRVFRVIS